MNQVSTGLSRYGTALNQNAESLVIVNKYESLDHFCAGLQNYLQLPAAQRLVAFMVFMLVPGDGQLVSNLRPSLIDITTLILAGEIEGSHFAR